MEKLNLKVEIAETPEQKKMADNIVVEYHSYVATPRVVGRCIKYLISVDGDPVATFWLGSGFKPTPKDILNFFDVGQKEFDGMFNEVADNKRFCILPNDYKNLGTQILKAIRGRAKKDWFDRYGNDLKAIVTTIGDGKKGSLYLADNWEHIGFTAGLPSNRKSVSMKWNDVETINERFIKPTGENKKKILITDRLK